MNRTPRSKRIQIIKCLVEGSSIRAAARIAGASKNTVTKLLIDIGRVCSDYQDNALRDLPCKRIQVDEIWSFVGKKQKNVTGDEGQWVGDAWTFTAICADTKLVPTWLVGARDGFSAELVLRDLESRLQDRIQLTTDGHAMYLEAVDKAFGAGGVDYAILQKIYGSDPEGQKRYSPAKCNGARKEVLRGDPDPAHVSTSYVERQNLTMRMSIRRFTRLTNAFSKKIENHAAAVSLHFMYYNYCRIHRSLRVTPAMAAGVTEGLWKVEYLLELLEATEDSAQDMAERTYKAN